MTEEELVPELVETDTDGQGLTLVDLSAQFEPFITLNTP
jgi:hypothetical protein